MSENATSEGSALALKVVMQRKKAVPLRQRLLSVKSA